MALILNDGLMLSSLPDPDRRLRDEALLLLEGRGQILETAREACRLMREAGIPGVVVGGVAVVLHGHVRSTRDVDIYLESAPEALASVLVAGGFVFDPSRREFIRDGVPIHLVRPEQIEKPPRLMVEIEGITTVSLPDLITIKLRSGTRDLLRAQDLADVIGLVRQHHLRGDFARHLDKELRPAFRKIARAIQDESP